MRLEVHFSNQNKHDDARDADDDLGCFPDWSDRKKPKTSTSVPLRYVRRVEEYYNSCYFENMSTITKSIAKPLENQIRNTL